MTVPAPQLRFLALGDSYTVGEGVPLRECWPMQLAARLRAHGVALAAPQIIARTGWTTDELSDAIVAEAPGTQHALVTLLIGVNNQYRGRELREYREQFAALLERAVEFAGDRPTRVLVVSIPDWGVTPFAREREPARIALEIDAFNLAAQQLTTGRGAVWVSVTEDSRRHGADRRYLVEDGLHPSAVAYREWAAVLEQAALKALRTD